MKSTRNAATKEAARADLKSQLLNAASRILAAEGPENLSTRRITEEVGASTMVFYSTFGSKQGLMEALWLEGFERFHQMELGVLAQDLAPFERLLGLCRVYRANALTNPEYFGITFGGVIKADTIPEEIRNSSRRVLLVLADAVADSMKAGHLVEGDSLAVATSLWASMHGFCALERANFFTQRDNDEAFDKHIRSNIRAYQ